MHLRQADEIDERITALLLMGNTLA